MKNITIKTIFFFFIFSICSCSSNIMSVFGPPVKPYKFTVDLKSPQIPLNETEGQFDNPIPFANMKKAVITISYFPYEDYVCLYYKVNNINYYQFWTKEARELFVRALESYNEEFEAKTLVRSSSKSKKMYGSVLGYLIWQEFKFSEIASSNLDLILGYYFKKSSPFFAITQGEALYEHINESRTRSSGEKPIYLTKAQAEEIALAFNQEFLIKNIPEEMLKSIKPEVIRSVIPDTDAY